MAKQSPPGLKKIKQVKFREGYYPITITLQAWEDGADSSPYIDLYSGIPGKGGAQYKHNHFKISNRAMWDRIKKIIDEQMASGLSKNAKPLAESTIERQVKEDLERLKRDKLRLEKTLQHQVKIVREYRDLKVPEYKKDLKRFEALLKTARKEDELQEFLATTPWLLGLEYETADPQKIAPAQRYDFYMGKYDGFADIIEIKKADEKLFDAKDKITSIFSAAIQQLINYIDDALIYGDSKRLSEKMAFSFNKPKGILIIGRDVPADRLRNFNFYFHNIEILTYSDVLNRGRSIVRHLESSKRMRSKKKISKKVTKKAAKGPAKKATRKSKT